MESSCDFGLGEMDYRRETTEEKFISLLKNQGFTAKYLKVLCKTYQIFNGYTHLPYDSKKKVSPPGKSCPLIIKQSFAKKLSKGFNVKDPIGCSQIDYDSSQLTVYIFSIDEFTKFSDMAEELRCGINLNVNVVEDFKKEKTQELYAEMVGLLKEEWDSREKHPIDDCSLFEPFSSKERLPKSLM